jgi:predicted transcriptional regulator
LQVANELTRQDPTKSQTDMRPDPTTACQGIREEEAATRHFLGRLRAATATEESFDDPDAGRQIWRDKEAVAHALYSRRLQLVEEELASLRQGKEQLSVVIEQMRATNEELERDLRQLPALVNKTFQLENNLLLRGKAAAGVWPKERFSDRLEAMERLESVGAAALRVGGGDQAGGVVTVEEDAEEAAFERRVRRGGRHQRVLVAGEGSREKGVQVACRQACAGRLAMRSQIRTFTRAHFSPSGCVWLIWAARKLTQQHT